MHVFPGERQKRRNRQNTIVIKAGFEMLHTSFPNSAWRREPSSITEHSAIRMLLVPLVV
jgi:hypothetical protein